MSEAIRSPNTSKEEDLSVYLIIFPAKVNDCQKTKKYKELGPAKWHTYTVMWFMNGPLTTHPVL